MFPLHPVAGCGLELLGSCQTVADSRDQPQVLQWRRRDLDYTKAREEQKKLLAGKHVIACALSEFAQYVRKAVLPESEPKPEEEPDVAKPRDTQTMVFVHTGQQDLELAKKIASGLNSKGYGYALPCYSGDPATRAKTRKTSPSSPPPCGVGPVVCTRCWNRCGLPEAINDGLYLTPRLTREQLADAIGKPTRLFGGGVQDELTNHFYNEAGNNPDQLPHALMRLWEQDQDEPSVGYAAHAPRVWGLRS